MRYIFASLFLSFFLANPAFACADEESYDLGNTTTPDMPLNRFVAGRIGVIDPRFGASYLLTAYRYLNHQPLTSGEQTSFMDFWKWYFLNYYAYDPQGSHEMIQLYGRYMMPGDIFIDATVKDKTPPPPFEVVKNQVSSRFKNYIHWRQARLTALQQTDTATPLTLNPETVKTVADVIRTVNNYYSDLAEKEDQLYLHDITLDGMTMLQLATQRLQKLAEQVKDPVIINSWIKAQQTLFKYVHSINKYSYSKPMDIEEVIQAVAVFPDNLPSLAKAEKNYFLAAINFYAQDPKLILQSADQFAALAADKSYPWHEWTAYMSNRAHALAAFRSQTNRNEILTYTDEEKNGLLQARNGMLALVKTTQDAALKNAAQKYADLILNRIEPNSYLYKTIDENITLDRLKDYMFWRGLVYTKSYDSDSSIYIKDAKTDQPLPGEITAIINTGVASANNWIRLYSISANKMYNRSSIFSYALKTWKTYPNRNAWLLLATNTLSYATLQERDEIIKAIEAIPATQADYLSLRAALLQQDDQLHFWQPSKRKVFIDTVLTTLKDNNDFSSKVFFLKERASLSENIDDLLKHSTFIPSTYLSSLYPVVSKPGYYFINDYNNLLQQLPLSVLIRVAKSNLLPETQRTALMASIWTRSTLLNNAAIENTVAHDLAKRAPELAPYIQAHLSNQNMDEKRIQLVSALLHFPYLTASVDLTLTNSWPGTSSRVAVKKQTLDHHDSYWWISGVLFQFNKNSWGINHIVDEGNHADVVQIDPASFLTDTEKKEYADQYQQLKQITNGTQWIVTEVIRLAEQHPSDVRFAELLALAVQATHYGDATSDLSKRAFTLLKKQYPKSEWAKRTKYYY